MKLAKEERLTHMLEVIDRIFRFVEGLEYETFLTNELAQYAVIKNFEIIGEAAYQLPKEYSCLLYTSPSPRDATLSRMPSSA